MYLEYDIMAPGQPVLCSLYVLSPVFSLSEVLVYTSHGCLSEDTSAFIIRPAAVICKYVWILNPSIKSKCIIAVSKATFNHIAPYQVAHSQESHDRHKGSSPETFFLIILEWKNSAKKPISSLKRWWTWFWKKHLNFTSHVYIKRIFTDLLAHNWRD